MRTAKKSASARQIQRERLGIDFDPAPPMALDTPADILDSVLKKAGLNDKVWEQSLAKEWEGIVGEQVATHTRPGQHKGKRLTIYVDSSPWLSALEREFKSVVLSNLQQKYGEEKIDTIFFCIDPDQ